MAISGQGTSVKVGTDEILGLNSASITVNGDPIDVTTFASGGWIEKIQGLKSATISLAGFWLAADTGQDVLRTALLSGVKQTLSTLLDDTNGWTGDFLVTSFDEGSTPSGAVSLSISLESTGAITQV